MLDDQDYVSLILYYGRAKFYHSMQKTALDGLSKHPGNGSFRLFNGIALALGNRVQEGIRELNPLKNEGDYAMAAILCLIYAHKRCNVIDKESVLSLDAKLKEEKKRLTPSSAYFSSVFLLMSGKIEKSREYVDKALRLSGNFLDAQVLKGWTELYLNPRPSKSLLEIFEKALANGKNIDASLGQVRYYQINHDFENAISVLNKLSVRFPELNIPLIEKMETQLASWNWDHAFETALRIINLDPTNISALRVKCILLLCREGSVALAVQTIQQLFAAIEKHEVNNLKLILHTAQLFSRACGRNDDVLSLTFKYVEKISQLSPANSEFLTEVGYHSIMMGHFKEASKSFRTVTKIDDSSIFALCGLTLCQIAENGVNEQARQQIEFLNEIQGINKMPLLLLMTSKIADNADKAIGYLIEASEIHFKNLQTLSFGPEYLLQFDPDFLLQVANELLQYSPVQSSVKIGASVAKDSLHISLKHSLNILEAVVKACPGLVRGIYMLAKVQFLCEEVSLASHTLNKILTDVDSTYTDAHLLLAQICIQQKQFAKASHSLEICLSHNFSVRENPMYHLLNGLVQKNSNQLEEAQKSFINALNLIGFKNVGSNTTTQTASTSPSKQKSLMEKSMLPLTDKVTLFLELIDIYLKQGQIVDCEKVMQTALEEFANSTENGRLIIASAEIALQHGNTNRAIDLLKSVAPGLPYYLQAKTRLAHVHLQYRKDRLAFAQCFKELVNDCPETESYLMLGDAYMSIQEQDLAIEAYKQALKLNPRDSLLASKLGRAYVKTHQYAKAINYYCEAITNPDHAQLKLDLAELYLKLKQYSNAEQTLIDEVDLKKTDETDVFLLQIRTKQLLLLARIREKSGNINSSLTTLKEARDNQYRFQKRISIDQSAGLGEQYKILSKICVLMAEQCISLRDNEIAVQHYKEALRYSPDDITILAALARLLMQLNQMDQCREKCAQILQMDANNEVASVMMADLSFRKMDFDNAAFHFSQLLLGQPTYWTALARLIEVMRRSGILQDAVAFLQRAEQNSTSPTMNAGFNYCKGLYEWYNGNPNAALRFFNNARRDSEWGQQAIFNMINICINPDGDLPTEGGALENVEDLDFKDSRHIALRTAERLIKELKPRPGGMDNEAVNHRLLKNFLQISSRQKYSIEGALNDFTDIASQEEYKDLVGPILGMACAHVLLKQTQRARNHLKRISKNSWNFEEAEYLERCWLLLADIYTQSSKYDMAQDLLHRVLSHNKSCSKAYELLGYIAEKEQAYRTAATNYDSAWKLCGKSKPQIGYKLAYNHMKTKRYADAIDVCQQVLKSNPDYPSIRKDILDKCRNNLRG